MSGEADRRERIEAALARFEASGKVKRGKRQIVKLFSLDEPQRAREKRHHEIIHDERSQ